jgi:hypothetical protein
MRSSFALYATQGNSNVNAKLIRGNNFSAFSVKGFQMERKQRATRKRQKQLISLAGV